MECVKATLDLMGQCSESNILNQERYQSVLMKCMECLNDANVNTEYKPAFFIVLGQLTNGGWCHVFNDNLSQVFKLYEYGYEASAKTTNDDLREYLEFFRENLVESMNLICFNALPQIVYDRKKQTEIYNHMQKLENFVFTTCHESENPTVEYLRDCVNLLIDFANLSIDNFTYSLYHDERYHLLINTLKRHGNVVGVPECLEYADNLMIRCDELRNQGLSR